GLIICSCSRMLREVCPVMRSKAALAQRRAGPLEVRSITATARSPARSTSAASACGSGTSPVEVACSEEEDICVVSRADVDPKLLVTALSIVYGVTYWWTSHSAAAGVLRGGPMTDANRPASPAPGESPRDVDKPGAEASNERHRGENLPGSVHTLLDSERTRLVLSGEIDVALTDELTEAVTEAESAG